MFSLLPFRGYRWVPFLPLLPEASGGGGRGDGVGFAGAPRGEAESSAAHPCSQGKASTDPSSQESTGSTTAGGDHGCGAEGSKATVSIGEQQNPAWQPSQKGRF